MVTGELNAGGNPAMGHWPDADLTLSLGQTAHGSR